MYSVAYSDDNLSRNGGRPRCAAFRGRLHLRPGDGGRADAVPDGDPAAVLRVLPGVPDGAGDRQAEEFGQKRHRGVIPIPNHLHTSWFLLAMLDVLLCTPSLRLAKAASSTSDLEIGMEYTFQGRGVLWKTSSS